MYRSKDATLAFHGGLNRHTKAARNLGDHQVRDQQQGIIPSAKGEAEKVKTKRRELGLDQINCTKTDQSVAVD